MNPGERGLPNTMVRIVSPHVGPATLTVRHSPLSILVRMYSRHVRVLPLPRPHWRIQALHLPPGAAWCGICRGPSSPLGSAHRNIQSCSAPIASGETRDSNSRCVGFGSCISQLIHESIGESCLVKDCVDVGMDVHLREDALEH